MVEAVYTIGHSTHRVEQVIAFLNKEGITVLGDVRSQPYSRWNPGFDREALKVALKEVGIGYVFLGVELGGRSEDRSCSRQGRVRFDLVAQTELFKAGIERVRRGADRYRLVLMCAEKEPLDCHRTILVARALVAQGVPVRHILSDGRIEDHARTVARLVAMLGLAGEDMFLDRDGVLEEAYARQGQKIAPGVPSRSLQRGAF